MRGLHITAERWMFDGSCVYGMMHGIIRRVRVFPIIQEGGVISHHREEEVKEKTRKEGEEGEEEVKELRETDDEEEGEEETDDEGEEEGEQPGEARSSESELMTRLLVLCDGHHCCDELCYRFAMSYRQLHRLLSTDLRVVFIHR